MKSFKDVVRELAEPAAARAFTLARQASHLAKVAGSLPTTKRLYGIKTGAIPRAIALAPRRIWIGDVAKLGHGILGVGYGKLGQLHVPVDELPVSARRVVERKLTGLQRRQSPRIARPAQHQLISNLG